MLQCNIELQAVILYLKSLDLDAKLDTETQNDKFIKVHHPLQLLKLPGNGLSLSPYQFTPIIV